MNVVVASLDFHPAVTTGTPGIASLRLVPTKNEDGKRVQDDESPFAPGSYLCEVSVDGEPKGAASFNIDYPECPTEVIIAGGPCFGFYPLEQQCPASGATGSPDPTCTCRAEGWECPQ